MYVGWTDRWSLSTELTHRDFQPCQLVNVNVIVKAPRQLCLTATYYRKENVKTNVVQFVPPF